jgi:hypothetical protein
LLHEIEQLDKRIEKLERVAEERDSVIGNMSHRIIRMEEQQRQQAQDIEDQGVAVDHAINTIDTILVPTQTAHEKQLTAAASALKEHEKSIKDLHDSWTAFSGGFSWVTKAGAVVGAISGVILLAIQIFKIIHGKI